MSSSIDRVNLILQEYACGHPWSIEIKAEHWISVPEVVPREENGYHHLTPTFQDPLKYSIVITISRDLLPRAQSIV